MVPRAIARILDWLDSPTLACRVGFSPGGPSVEMSPPFSTDTALYVGTTGIPEENAEPPRGTLPPGHTTPLGLRLSITRPPTLTSGSVLVICALFPIPPLIRRFRLTGGFALPRGPGGQSDQWAPILVARGGADILDTTDAKPVGATHQVRFDTDKGYSGITLGSAGGTGMTPSPKDTIRTWDQAYDGHPHTFELQADIDCYQGAGWSTLWTSPEQDQTWQNVWSHPYVQLKPAHPETPIGLIGLGVGLGMVGGTGTASVIATGFSVYVWNQPSPWWRRLIVKLF
jgi:hypothetical protein